jgi:hypothetical protein
VNKEQDKWAVALGVASVSVMERVTEIVGAAIVEVLGQQMAGFLEEQLPDFDGERFQQIFEKSLFKAVEAAEMEQLKRMVAHDER